MKIKYIHFENPEEEKEVDFGLLYQNQYLPFHRSFFPGTEEKSQEEWEKGQLERLKKKVEQGIYISYRIID